MKEGILRALSIINNKPMNEREPLQKISSTNNNKKLIDNKAIKLIFHETNINISLLKKSLETKWD